MKHESLNYNILDIADYFLHKDEMTNKKLQKMCYYAYSWHLALFGKRLFNEQFQAWIHGPVSPLLYHEYKVHGWSPITKSVSEFNLSKETQSFLNDVFDSYGHLTGDELEYITHQEDPWITARQGLDDLSPCKNIIDDEIIEKFYKSTMEESQIE